MIQEVVCSGLLTLKDSVEILQSEINEALLKFGVNEEGFNVKEVLLEEGIVKEITVTSNITYRS